MKKILLLTSVVSLCYSGAFADVVDEIKFEGLDRVEEDAIKESITIKPHHEYTQNDINESLKALYKKEFFSHIKFVKRGNSLVIICQERPMVDKVAFEGNDAASNEALNNIINGRIGEGRLFSLSVVKDILSDLQLAYKTLGYYSVNINPKIIRRTGNKIDLVFEIQEGTKTTVKKILFVGNKNFTDDELKDILSTKEEKAWRFWDYESHVFREDKVDVDIENLTAFYKNHGYPFFMVVSVSAEMDFDKKSHYCTFTVEEGDEYSIKGVSLTSDVEKIKAKDFQEFLEIEDGIPFNEGLINATRDRIRKEVSLRDNPFIDVDVNIDYDKEHKTASVQYKIVKRQKAFVERIEIVGNTRTLDRVIRREFAIHEGDAYNAYKVQRTVERLKSSEYFEDVQVSDRAGSADDKRVLVVKVKEKESTAQLRFGLNVSDADGFGGFVGFVENNLFGTGRAISTDVFWMQKYYGCKLGIFEPRFMDKNFGVGVNVGAHRYDRKKIDQSVTRSVYISPFIRYAISERIGHKVAYTLSNSTRRWWNKGEGKLYDKVPNNVAETPLMRDEYGKFTCAELTSVLFYNATDNPYEPHKGYDISMTNSYAGLGGGVRYFKNELSANYYYSLTQKLTFVTSGNIGYIKEMRNTRSCDRYALGGDGQSMRGFDSYGVGTRDLKGNSVGGNKYWTVSFMLKAPLSTREIGMNGVAFIDFGSAWGTKYDKRQVHDSSAIRASAGVAIEWARSPLGVPLSLVFGFPLKKQSFDQKQTFTLTGFM